MANKQTPPEDPLPSGRQPGDDDDPMPFASPPTKALVPQVGTQNGTAFVDEAKTTIARRSPFGDEVETSRESAMTSAQIKATILARTVQAMNHPRDFDACYAAIMRDCLRPAFADAAVYKLPGRSGGKPILGLSIRFAESALAHWRNVATDSIVISDTDEKRVLRILVSDIERNVWHGRDITIMKVIERREPKRGQEVVGQRVNSTGQIVYQVRPTDEEMAQAEARERSRVLRNEGLRLIPADIREEAFRRCQATAADSAAKDPDETRKKVVMGFMDMGVTPDDLATFLGCSVAQTTPAQLSELKEIYSAIRDGDATFQQFVAARTEDLSPDDDDTPPAGSAVDAIKQKAKEKAAARKAAKS